jgi:signal transduction histidine kinase
VASTTPSDARVRLGEVISRHRAQLVDRLAGLEWRISGEQASSLARGQEVVRPRVELFLDVMLEALLEEDWRRFDVSIGAWTSDLLASEVISIEEIKERFQTLATLLIPYLLEEPDPAPVLGALFMLVQSTTVRIVRRYSQRLLEDSRQLDDLKTMFLRMTGHELRSPLGTIRGYTSMLQEGDFGALNPVTRRAVDVIHTSATTGLGMIDRLVEVARLESGSEALHRERNVLDEVVLAAIQPLKEEARTAGVELKVEAGTGEVTLDAEEIAIALRNLVANALKYGAEGGVVTVRAGTDHGVAWFEVADRGAGIAPEELQRVFERYYRSVRSRQLGITGSGLGLYIVKRIAELHGGEATASDTPGGGATFRIRIPAA